MTTTNAKQIQFPLHAVAQVETGAVYGVGATALAAVTDAARSGCNLLSTSACRISRRAAGFVEASGGAPSQRLSFGKLDGVPTICLRSEEV